MSKTWSYVAVAVVVLLGAAALYLAFRIPPSGDSLAPMPEGSGAGVSGALVKEIAKKAKEPLTREERFEKLDKDSDGYLTLAEYRGKTKPEKAELVALRFENKDQDADAKLSLKEFTFRPGEVTFANADADGNGKLSLEEFQAPSESGGARARATEAFAMIDGDGDGMVTQDEFLNRSFEARFVAADIDGDGAVTQEEFLSGRDSSDARDLAKKVFRQKDEDADGKLTLEEFSGGDG